MLVINSHDSSCSSCKQVLGQLPRNGQLDAGATQLNVRHHSWHAGWDGCRSIGPRRATANDGTARCLDVSAKMARRRQQPIADGARSNLNRFIVNRNVKVATANPKELLNVDNNGQGCTPYRSVSLVRITFSVLMTFQTCRWQATQWLCLRADMNGEYNCLIA